MKLSLSFLLSATLFAVSIDTQVYAVSYSEITASHREDLAMKKKLKP